VAPQPPPSFRADLALVYLDVHASQEGHPLRGLTAPDFEVLDEGVPQAISLVVQRRPIYAILLLDTSGSVAGDKFEQLRAAARVFLADLGDDDRAALLTFSHEVRLQSPVAALPSEVAPGIDAVQVGGATSLYDAVYAALSLADPAVGRPVVLVFSDGEDRLSVLPAANVVTAARESQASIFAVELRPGPEGTRSNAPPRPAPEPKPGRTGMFDIPPTQNRLLLGRPVAVADRAVPFLERVVTETGGRLWRTQGPGELRSAFLQVLEEVKSRYLLGYEPQGVAAAGWHKLEVRLKRVKGSVQARAGYLAQLGEP
jgi:VWFA-related protein